MENQRSTSDVYNDIELPFPDIKVAGLLCIGGPCKYKVKGNCTGITDNSILQHVVPNISNQLGPTLAVILGTALLWYVFSPEGDQDVPAHLHERAMGAYNQLPANQRAPVDENPVEKIPVVISGNEGEVGVDEIPDGLMNNGNVGNNGNGGNGGNNNNNNNNALGGGGGGALGGLAHRPIREQLLALHSQNAALRRS
jgi:hypothetical protein